MGRLILFFWAVAFHLAINGISLVIVVVWWRGRFGVGRGESCDSNARTFRGEKGCFSSRDLWGAFRTSDGGAVWKPAREILPFSPQSVCQPESGFAVRRFQNMVKCWRILCEIFFWVGFFHFSLARFSKFPWQNLSAEFRLGFWFHPRSYKIW